MLGKNILFVFCIFLLTFYSYSLAATPTIPSLPDNEIPEKPIRAELTIRIGSDNANEDFFKLPAFAVAKDGQICILDSGNSRIQCFSKEGKFLFGFGRLGQGPGELSNNARKIKILPDGNIYVIDNSRRRIQDWPWIMFDMSLRNDNQVVVPYLNPKTGVFYIDIYAFDLNLISRYRLLNMIADIGKGENISQILVDNDNSLYAMVISKEDYPKLVKYKLIFD